VSALALRTVLEFRLPDEGGRPTQDVLGTLLRVIKRTAPGVMCTPSDSDLDVALDVEESTLEIVVHGPCLRMMEQLAVSLREALHELGVGLSVGFAQTAGPEAHRYPRVRPPVWHLDLETNAILDLVDLAFHRSNRPGARRAEAEAMAEAPLPEGATRTRLGELVLIRWAEGATDRRSLALAAGRHERWLARTIALNRADGYNDEGDLRVDMGKESRVWLVTPAGRRAALESSLKARQLGFGGVAYAADGKLWDPCPDGWWSE
jgi:hypothetical protein